MKIKPEQLKKARKELCITQEKFAEIINISANHYVKIEHGRTNPSIPVFLQMCKALKKPADYFFTNSVPYLTAAQYRQLMQYDKKDLEMLLALLQMLYDGQNKSNE